MASRSSRAPWMNSSEGNSRPLDAAFGEGRKEERVAADQSARLLRMGVERRPAYVALAWVHHQPPDRRRTIMPVAPQTVTLGRIAASAHRGRAPRIAKFAPPTGLDPPAVMDPAYGLERGQNASAALVISGRNATLSQREAAPAPPKNSLL